MYRFKTTSIKPDLDISEIMASTAGMEKRFANRFTRYAGTSETFNQSVDVTGQAIDDLRTSAGMINEQKKGIDKLFVSAERAIQALTHLEKESGVHQVDNIPLPNVTVRESYGKKLGYVSLSVNFLSEGILHFMEETINLKAALDSRDVTISRLAGQIPTMEVIGAFEELTLKDLTSPAIDVSSYEKNSDKPKSPVVNGKTPSKKKQ